eukprot:m.234326 g.234326  ORF g.234326 m.234326 type:complete len:209 (-) comp19557_c0_seq1:30-656(-)
MASAHDGEEEDGGDFGANPTQLAPGSRSESRVRSLRRCLVALKLTSTEQLQTLVTAHGHVYAREELDRKGRKVIRLHMNGTKNSRRFLHVYLWWIRHLGVHYPVSDNLLQAPVWKYLRCICQEGVTDLRAPRQQQLVCINPRHYEISRDCNILSILTDDIRVLTHTERGEDWLRSNPVACAFLDQLSAFLSPEKDFAQVTEFIRTHCE